MHWRRARHAKGRRRSLLFNSIGAGATFATLVIITISKFKGGAWPTVLLIPPMVLMFRRVRKYHSEVAERLTDEGSLDLGSLPEPIVAMSIKRLASVSRKAIRHLSRLRGSRDSTLERIDEERGSNEWLAKQRRGPGAPHRLQSAQVGGHRLGILRILRPVYGVIEEAVRGASGPPDRRDDCGSP